MLTAEFCRGKAEEYELRAAEFTDPRLRAEWELMALDWLVAADEPPPIGQETAKQPRRHQGRR